MTTGAPERLYRLLPATYRARDAEHGEALRILLAVIDRELQGIEDDIAGLYRDWFIETCSDWVIPYIGDMLGVRPMHEIVETAGFTLRAYVANTLAYRRRKGTAPVLEQIARDVTGWRSRVVEFFESLSATQHMNHVRLHRPATLDLRDPNALELLEGPFQSAAHTVDVRRIDNDEGWYNIPNVGLFVYRLQPYLIANSPARRVTDERYRFSPLGHDAPLFHVPVPETDITHLADETNVPIPVRRLGLHLDLEAYAAINATKPFSDRSADSAFYGPSRGINVIVNGQMMSPLDVVSSDLSAWESPPTGKIAVDPASGRLAFAVGEDPGIGRVFVSFAYGFSGDIGGGPYERIETLEDVQSADWAIQVARGTAVPTLQAALTAWQAAGRPNGVIQINDNSVYGGNLDVDLPAGGTLTIQAANGVRPNLRHVGNTTLSGGEDSRITLNGLLLEGALELSGQLEVRILHSTLVPGMRLLEDGQPQFPDRDSIVCANPATDIPLVVIERSIVGSIRLPEEAMGLAIADSIVDGLRVAGVSQLAISGDDDPMLPGPPTRLERVTVLGPVFVRQLDLASEVIFTDPVNVVRRQEGCVRFSFVPDGSHTPRRFQCQPDLALAKRASELGLVTATDLPGQERAIVLAHLTPRFTSEHYGEPGYCQLSHHCAIELRAGAEDGSEMGAFEYLKNPHREANLRTALDEYLPFGLQAGQINVT